MIRSKLVGTFSTNGTKFLEIQGIIHVNTVNFGFRDALLRVSRGGEVFEECLKVSFEFEY
jgi:hypothetical protein